MRTSLLPQSEGVGLGVAGREGYAAERIENPADQFKEGQEVTALVVKVDAAEQKISLSIRAVDDKEERRALQELAAQQSTSQTTTLGDLLAEKLAAKQGEEEGEGE